MGERIMTTHVRLAKLSDVKQIANLHMICSSEQPMSIMWKFGKYFFKRYYRILLEEKNSVILCAEDMNGDIVGIVSGSLKAEEHIIALRRNRVSLFFASVPSLFRNPRLIGDMYSRQKAGSADEEGGGYIVLSGAREEFWAWLPTKRLAGGAIELHKTWLSVMRLLGASRIQLEVDRINERVARMHQMMGARVIKEFVTPDGRHRMVMEYEAK